MSGFYDPLLIREIAGDDRRWGLREPCVYCLGRPDGTEWVEAPIGFITDFGSIPQPLWGFPRLSPFGKYRRAYVIHDQLYVAPVVRSATRARAIDRAEADHILREALGVLGAGWWTREVIVRQVRIWGWVPWHRYRKADAERSPAVGSVPRRRPGGP